MDVRTFGSWTSAQETILSCDPSSGAKSLGPGRPPRLPGHPRDVPAQKFPLWAAFPAFQAGEGASSVTKSARPPYCDIHLAIVLPLNLLRVWQSIALCTLKMALHSAFLLLKTDV